MNKKVLTLLFPGFEEIEFVAPVDILRRAGVEVTVASITEQKLVTGRSNITIQADTTISAVSPETYDLLFLPGGPGVKSLRNNPALIQLIKNFRASGKYISAICAAPTLLKDAGILGDCKFTAHFTVKQELQQALTAEKVVEDKKIITSRGAGTAVELGLHLVKVLCGNDVSSKIAEAIMV